MSDRRFNLAGWATLRCAQHSWLVAVEARDGLRPMIEAAWRRGDLDAFDALHLSWLEASIRARLAAAWLDRLIGDDEDG